MPLFSLYFRYMGWEGPLAPRQAAHEQPRWFPAIAQRVIKAKCSFYLNAKQDELGPWGESGPRDQLGVMPDM